MAATAASALPRPATAPGCACEECEPECVDECESRRLPDDTRLLLLLELLAPLTGAVSEEAKGAPDWSRNNCEEDEEVLYGRKRLRSSSWSSEAEAAAAAITML